MIVKCFECTTIHNKALYKCIIHSCIYIRKICNVYILNIFIYDRNDMKINIYM